MAATPMRLFMLCLCSALPFFGGCSPKNEAKTTHSTTAAPSEPKGLVFTAPPGFEEKPENHLYYHAGLRVSISPAYQPGADFDKVAAEFTEENLQANGAALKQKNSLSVNGRKTLVVKCERLKSKYPQTSTTVLFPTKNGCAQLTAIYPTDLALDMQQQIDNAVINARYNE
jgi:hypothetical protein